MAILITNIGIRDRNWGVTGGSNPPDKIFSPLVEKCVGHSLKVFDIV